MMLLACVRVRQARLLYTIGRGGRGGSALLSGAAECSGSNRRARLFCARLGDWRKPKPCCTLSISTARRCVEGGSHTKRSEERPKAADH